MASRLLMFGGGGLALAAAGLAAIFLMEDRDETLRKEFGISVAYDCYSPDPSSEYHRQNDVTSFIEAARELAGKIGPVGETIRAGELGAKSPICVIPGQRMAEPLIKGGFTQPYVVVSQDKNPSWLVAQFMTPRIHNLESSLTSRTNKYTTQDALLWSRLRHAVPAAYEVYALHALAVADSSDNVFSQEIWQEVKKDSTLGPVANAFEQQIRAGATAEKAYVAALQAYLVTPAALNARDIEFLRWYKDEVGEQKTDIHYSVECEIDGDTFIDLTTTLPEGVYERNVIDFRLENDVDYECDHLVNSEIARVRDEKNSLIGRITDLEDSLKSALSADVKQGEEASTEDEISSIESTISTLERRLENLEPQDQSYTDYKTVYHDPSSTVHSIAFDPQTLVNYVGYVAGRNLLTHEDASGIVNSAAYSVTHSAEAQRLFDESIRNARQYARNYNGRDYSLNEGLRVGFR